MEKNKYGCPLVITMSSALRLRVWIDSEVQKIRKYPNVMNSVQVWLDLPLFDFVWVSFCDLFLFCFILLMLQPTWCWTSNLGIISDLDFLLYYSIIITLYYYSLYFTPNYIKLMDFYIIKYVILYMSVLRITEKPRNQYHILIALHHSAAEFSVLIGRNVLINFLSAGWY